MSLRGEGAPTGPITHLGPDGTVPAQLHDLLTPATLSLAGANVIMQLAQLPVGRGVAESKVDSGNLYKHPLKRARTTREGTRIRYHLDEPLILDYPDLVWMGTDLKWLLDLARAERR